MNKKLQFLIATLFFTNWMFCQTDKAWSDVKDKSFSISLTADRLSFPDEFRLKQLSISLLKEVLVEAPKRSNLQKSSAIISMPSSNGTLERFEIYEVSNFDEALQNQFPDIRAYVGVGLDDTYARLRLSIDGVRISGMISRADKATEFIEPYSENGKIYAIYDSSRKKGKLPFTCSTPEQDISESILNKATSVNKSSTGQLLTFRLAMSVTPEYTNYHHLALALATPKTSALSAINTTMSRVNGVFETDFAIHMNLINNLTIIYDGSIADPYGATDANYNSELQSTLTSVVGAANYDVGHLMGNVGNNGNAGCIGCVCGSLKGSGYTTSTVPVGDSFDIDFVAHELGHQFGANHTFSHANEGSGVNMEVGSGITVMGYAGITPYDTHSNSIDVFHAASIAQVQANMASKTCPTVTSITHSAPVVNAGSAFTIPRSTPFMLTGSATDAGGAGGLTYTWEQYNNASNTQIDAASAASATKTTGPNWTNYTDSSSPSRRFPVITSTLNNSLTTQGLDVTSEALSSVARTLAFRLTARDNVLGIGQTNFANTTITVNGFSGPFDVTSQNTSGIVWSQGSSQTITWLVNGTTNLAGSSNVDILLSIDGGLTYPTTLASNVLNNGSAIVTAPSIDAAYCRIMVKPTGNIYYDINTTSFAIGNYTYQTQNVCTDYVRNFNNLAIPENSTNFTGYTIPVSDAYTITDLNIKVEITHPNLGSIYLGNLGPYFGAALTQYFSASCPGSSNMNLIFDDQGPALNCSASTSQLPTKPVGTASFAANNGEQSNGSWTFFITDANVGDGITGTIQKVTYNICRTGLVPVLASENFEGISDLVLYPNPNKGNFTIQFNSNSSKVAVEIHDIRGRKVYDNNFNTSGLFNEELNLQSTQAGIYLVSIVDGERREVKKIVIE